MEINCNENILVESEWEVIRQLVQFAMDVQSGKVVGVSIKINAKELEDCRNILRKAKDFT